MIASEAETEERVRQALRAVIDPEVGIDVVELGLVYGISVAAQAVTVDMTMTSPSCPLGESITDQAVAAIRGVVGESASVEVRLVWEPPWSPERMTPEARQALGWG
ncbi:MAG: metal-sulfur cluster assembly factor [Alphaproteobacteria bacterium]|nr:metal-sulfur cluster assembly factor [Alphaproteobacteria bacterium]